MTQRGGGVHGKKNWMGGGAKKNEGKEDCTKKIDQPFKPWYQIANSPFVFPYISYESSGEKLLKYQENLT